MRVFIAGALVAVLFFQASAISAAPTDTVVLCQLTSERHHDGRGSSLEEVTQKPRAIHEQFVLKFDDAKRRVTYIANPLVAVKPNPPGLDENFENMIFFAGDSGAVVDGLIARYVGSISRLTGDMALYDVRKCQRL